MLHAWVSSFEPSKSFCDKRVWAGCRRGGFVAKILDSLVSDMVKRLVLNPEYMRAAWMREIENSLVRRLPRWYLSA